MQLAHFTDQLFVELLGIRSLVEVEITAEKFITTLAAQNHFDSHRFNYAGQQVHWS